MNIVYFFSIHVWKAFPLSKITTTVSMNYYYYYYYYYLFVINLKDKNCSIVSFVE